jgi:predicted PurR-regulated permease PerM
MADRSPPTIEAAPADIGEPGLSGTLTAVVSGVVIAGLYFAREILVPFALAVLLSFLLAPAVRWRRGIGAGRVAAVAITALVAFVAIFGLAAILTQEVSSLGPKLPEYRYNIAAKIRTLPHVGGGGAIERFSTMLHQLRAELTRSEKQLSPSAGLPPNAGGGGAEAAKPLPVEFSNRN